MAKLGHSTYDDRVQRTLEGIADGLTREQMADEFGLGNWKSLDVYMRRKGYIWDKYKQQYILLMDKIDVVKQKVISAIPVKAQQVIDRFELRGQEADPKKISLELGFTDHRQMVTYMESQKLYWDVDVCNYVERYNMSVNEVTADIHLKSDHIAKQPHLQDGMPDYLATYLPLLQLLEANKERLTVLLQPAHSGQIPKYAVPGAPKTKSIYMSDLLAKLVTQFSMDKNLSQREIVEAALVDYLKQYGYKQEMERLLGKR